MSVRRMGGCYSGSSVNFNMSLAGTDPEGGDCGDRAPKTYDSDYVHHDF